MSGASGQASVPVRDDEAIVLIPEGRDPRSRLIAALAAEIRARAGYQGMTSEKVCAQAKASKKTFYKHFDDIGSLFLAMYEVYSQHMLAHVTAAVDPDSPAHKQAEQALMAWVDAVYSDPQVALAVFRELPALGPEAHDAQRTVLLEFASSLLSMLRRDRDARPVGLFESVFLLGGVREAAIYALDSGTPQQDMRESMASLISGLVDAETCPNTPTVPGWHHVLVPAHLMEQLLREGIPAQP
ncbi:TetR/AcrR family transcriptional regulator [Nocardia sp. CA2R105]|uniref:TetR/AcrR family transcriptional regulator n=1 Tax=Nocardia coffeae TaxID=2873381 RepID=UPI001CA6E86C|nr:TetR/AcrR family transcriptional regulator [Nocardia coffeae]MBY8863904.1 TetR/AcrR family transcriptional regulator [Nocardia coffeae]